MEYVANIPKGINIKVPEPKKSFAELVEAANKKANPTSLKDYYDYNNYYSALTAGSKTKLITNYIYFYHLDKFCVLPFFPDSVTDTSTASFNATNALGRSAPVQSYINSGPRTVNWSFKVHRDLLDDVNLNISNLKDETVDINDDYMDVLIKYLQSVSYPKYNEYSSMSKGLIPPMVALRFGDTIFIKGVVSSGITVTYEKPIIDNKYAVATIGFTITEIDPYDADYVASMGSFRGITQSFKDGIFKSTETSLNDVSGKSMKKLKDTSVVKKHDTKLKSTVPSVKPTISYGSMGTKLKETR